MLTLTCPRPPSLPRTVRPIVALVVEIEGDLPHDGRELRQYRVVGYMDAEKFRALLDKAVVSTGQSI